MASDDGVDAFPLILGTLAGFVFSIFGWDALVNTHSKKQVLDEYAQTGVNVPARLVRQTVTSHRTNCIQTRMSLEVQYAYLAPGPAGWIYTKKHKESSPGCGASIELFPQLFLVTVLPDYPRSGIPKKRVEKRETEFGQGAQIIRVVICFVFVFLGACFFVAGFEDDDVAANWFFPVMFIMLLSGAPCNKCIFNNWKKELLEKVVNETARATTGRRQGGTSYEAVPVAEATVIPEGDQGPGDAAHPVAFARAVPAQDMDVEAGRGSGGAVRRTVLSNPGAPLPDALAETILKEAKDLSFNALLETLPNLREGSWALRASYVYLAAENWASKSVTPLTGCPDTAVGNLFKGVYYICRAWDVRGSGLANTVARNAWAEFGRGLNIAREALLRSAEQDPEDPSPYSFLTGSVAKGLQVSDAQAIEWFEAAVERDPLNRLAHTSRMSSLCEKWGGSHEAMFAFARETCQKAPEDSPLRGILLDAFYEQWLFHSNITKDKKAARAYLLDANVRRETMAIYNQAFAGHGIEKLSDCASHESAANWLILLGEKEAAHGELNKLRPWQKVLRAGYFVTRALRNPSIIDVLKPSTTG